MEEALKPWHSLPKITMARRMAGATAACACVLTGALFTSAYAALADRHCADGHLLQPPEQHASSGNCIEDLPNAIDTILRAALAASALWGAEIRSEELGLLYARNANSSFIPASNTKLLMASAALLRLGEGFRWQTTAYLGPSGVVCVDAVGDPSLSQARLEELLKRLATAAPGVRAELQLAHSTSSPPPTWEYGDLSHSYGAEPAAATIDGNTVVVTVAAGASEGAPLQASFAPPSAASMFRVDTNRSRTAAPGSASSVTAVYELDALGQLVLVLDGSLGLGAPSVSLTRSVRPASRLFASHLREAARLAGFGALEVTMLPVGVGCTSGAASASTESEALLPLLNQTLQESDNLYAELTLRAIGRGSVSDGLAATATAISSLGVSSASVMHVDGSGLSRHNVASPAFFVALLEAMRSTALRDLLPVSGRTGTLAHRFIGTPAEGIVHAKTGTMTGVSALSGYLRHADPAVGEIVFSLLGNNVPAYGGALRQFQDAIVIAIAKARHCGGSRAGGIA